MGTQKKGKTILMTAGQLARLTREMPVRHEPFDEPTREQIRTIQTTFEEVHPMTMGEWELGFRRDTNPQKEIAIWLKAGEIYRSLTERMTSKAARQEVFAIIASSFLCRRSQIQKKRPEILTNQEFKAVLKALYPNGREESIVYNKPKLVQGTSMFAQIPVAGCEPVRLSDSTATAFNQINKILEENPGADPVTICYCLLTAIPFSCVSGLEEGFGSPAVHEAYAIFDSPMMEQASVATQAALIVEILRHFAHVAQEKKAA